MPATLDGPRRTQRPPGALGLALLLLAAGCGGGSTMTAADMTGGGGSDGGMGDPNVLAGSFQVRLVAPVPASMGNPEMAGFTTIVGKVSDGPTPSLIVWEKAATDGACTLSKPRVPFCAQPCGGSAACVENDKCQAYPSGKNIGTVHVTGVRTEAGKTEFDLTSVSNTYQPPADVKCPYPAFDEGADLRLDAAGGVYGAFTLKARGIRPLVLGADPLVLDSGKPLTVKWTAAGQANISTIHVKLDISHHGGTKGMIECDTPDTGSLTISAALVDQLKALGVAGYPSIIVSRRATGSTTLAPGRVDMVVSSEVEVLVSIPGLKSCTDTSECPMGQTCQSDLTCK